MRWIDLGDPLPRAQPHRYTPLSWPDGSRVPLQPLEALPKEDPCFGRSMLDLATRRRSARSFSSLPQDKLGWLLALADGELARGDDHLGFPLSRRPAPSAGAIHPLHVVVQSPSLGGWHRYEPHGHELASITCSLNAHSVREELDQLVVAPSATLLLLAAEHGKTEAKYSDPCSLVWRDAGILLGYLSIAAEALDLAFVPLGVTGDQWVRALLDEAGLAGVGAAFVGARVR